MFKPSSMLASVALVLAALVSPAAAADGKSIFGSACQPSDDSRLSQLNRGGGSIFNAGSATEFVACPVVKDLNKIKLAVVRLIDRNAGPGADIACTLVTLRSNGTIQATKDLRSNGSSTAPQSLNFGAQPAAANGSYDLFCGLPPQSEILNYTVTED